MSTLICGSVAYDTIMVFHDRFTNHILPDKIHVLNVSFLVPQLRREFGGCAGNIAYNLKLLGGDPLPMATVGKDFGPYSQWMDECGVDHRHVTRIDTEYTAQAFITTDLDDNQITAFHPGAMSSAHLNDVRDASGVTIGIVAPDAREAMIEHASQFAERGTAFIFDLGQGMPLFDGDDLRRFIDLATWLTFNDYEWEVVRQRTGLGCGGRGIEGRSADRDARRPRVGRAHPRGDHRDPARPRRRHGGSDGLRRRVPRRNSPRARQRHGLGDHRTPRLADGRAQDRAARHPEPPLHPLRHREPIPRIVRAGPVADLQRARCTISDSHFRSAPLGSRASCPLEPTGGPSAGRPLPASGRVRAGRPRSQGRVRRSRRLAWGDAK